MFRHLEDLANPFQPYEESTPSSSTWSFIREHLRPLRKIIVLSLTMSVISAALEIWLIYYASRLVDILNETSRERLWREHGTEFLIVGALVLLIRPLAWFGREALDDIAFRPNAVTLVRWRSHRHLLGQSVGWFQNDLAGRVALRIREIGLSATGAAYAALHTLSFVIVYIIGSIVLMGSMDIRLVIPLAIWVGLYIGLMIYAVPGFRDTSERFQSADSALTGMLVDTYSNIDIFKLYGRSDESESTDRRYFEDARSSFINMQRFEVTINSGMMFLGTILMVGLVGYSLVLWQSGDAPLGLIAAAVALSYRISGMAEWLLDAVASLFGHIGAARESLRTVAQPRDIVDVPGAQELNVKQGTIRFHNVSHHYGKGTGGLDCVSLEIAAGERVGLVGRSGAGKSTLVNLLLRFFEAEEGTIEIDGQSIRTVTQDSLWNAIAMVGQDAVLLHRSVRENIAPGNPSASPARIVAAAERAEAANFIPSLRDLEGRSGYDAFVGERGVKLSGGQRQRIAIARAIFKDAPILVLDEATSALDSEVESAIQSTLDIVMEGKTVIAIAHRLSTIARMDRIVVLDEGRIVETGTHEQLIERGGIYAGLWERQSNGFIG